MKHSDGTNGSSTLKRQTILTTLFDLGQRYFQEIVTELKGEGCPIHPELKLCEGDGLLCDYDSATQTILLAMPDRDSHQGHLQMVVLRSLFDCASDSEMIAFLRHALRWLIAHEVAHHCRHQLGILSKNIWQEDQIANYLAIAVSKPHFSDSDLLRCDVFLKRGTRNLADKTVSSSNAVDTYHSLLHSLFVANLIDTQTFKQIVKIRKKTGHLCEVILKNNLVSNLPPDIVQRIDNRHRLIRRINAGEYENVVQYLYYYFGWMQIGLMSVEDYTLKEFREHFLNDNHLYV